MSAHQNTYILGERDRRRVAVAADCDPRSVRRYLRGELVRPSTIARIERALAQLGFDDERANHERSA